MPKPWEIYQSQQVSQTGGRKPWELYQAQDEGPSQLEAVARGGAQGLTLGYADEAVGGAQAVRDYILGRKSVFDEGIGDIYRRNRDMEREKFAEAREAHPKTYGAAQIGGAVLPTIAATVGTKGAALPAISARLAALGATEALGHSEADLTQGEFGQAAQETALGGAIGGALPPAMRGVSKMAGVAARPFVQAGKAIGEKLGPMVGPASIGKRGLSAATNVPLESIEARIARPGAIKAAETSSFARLAEKDLPEAVGKLSAKVSDLSTKALDTLRPKAKYFNVKELTTYLSRLQGGTKIKGATIGAGEGTFKALGKLKNQIAKMAPKVKGKPSQRLPAKNNLTEGDMKQVIKSIDDLIDWKDTAKAPQNRALKEFRHYLNGKLGANNPKYAEAMKPLAVHTELLENLEKKFALQRGYTPTGQVQYRPTDPTAQRIKAITDEKKLASRADLRKLRRLTEGGGDDIIQKAEDVRLAAPFKGGRPQGSRSVAQYAIAGSGLGYGAGGPAGSFIGGVLGAGVGSHVDKFGGQYAARILDAFKNYRKGNITLFLEQVPQAFGKWAPLLKQAAARGGNSLITTHYVLQQQDPEYRKQLKNIEDEFQGAVR